MKSFIIIKSKFDAINLRLSSTDRAMPFCKAPEDYARSGDQNWLANVLRLPLKLRVDQPSRQIQVIKMSDASAVLLAAVQLW